MYLFIDFGKDIKEGVEFIFVEMDGLNFVFEMMYKLDDVDFVGVL